MSITQKRQEHEKVDHQTKQTSATTTTTTTKRKRDVSSQELNRHLQSSSSRLPMMKKRKKTVFVQSFPLNNISVNKNYPYVSYSE